uniref:Uncharacterized protein n=1 Tax=Cannabis sativa TaxID=3483 RepID=A0A803PWF4_CANSA
MYGNYSSPIYTRAADNGQSEWGFQFHHQGMAYHPQLEDVLEQPVSNSSTASSGCSSYSSPSSLGSAAAHHLQRSESSHSLQNKNNGAHRALSSVAELLIDSQTSSVRRVYSTGDLQRIKMMQHSYRYSSSESPISSESNAIIEGMNKACRYSPEEKKERIERVYVHAWGVVGTPPFDRVVVLLDCVGLYFLVDLVEGVLLGLLGCRCGCGGGAWASVWISLGRVLFLCESRRGWAVLGFSVGGCGGEARTLLVSKHGVAWRATLVLLCGEVHSCWEGKGLWGNWCSDECFCS